MWPIEAEGGPLEAGRAFPRLGRLAKRDASGQKKRGEEEDE